VVVLTDERWAVLEPLVEQVKPRGKTPLVHVRRTIEAIIWRCSNGAKWRAIPAELGPWWSAAQTFIRWSRLGVWQRLLALVQAKGVVTRPPEAGPRRRGICSTFVREEDRCARAGSPTSRSSGS
jgi:transposase